MFLGVPDSVQGVVGRFRWCVPLERQRGFFYMVSSARVDKQCRLKPSRTSHCGIASASLACPAGALAVCPAHVVYGYWARVILMSVSVHTAPTRTHKSKADARPLRSPRPFGDCRKRSGAGSPGGTPARNSTQKTPQRASVRKRNKTWRLSTY